MTTTPTATELPAKVTAMADRFATIEIVTVGTCHWPKTHLPADVGIGSELFVGMRPAVGMPVPMEKKPDGDYENMRRLLEELIN